MRSLRRETNDTRLFYKELEPRVIFVIERRIRKSRDCSQKIHVWRGLTLFLALETMMTTTATQGNKRVEINVELGHPMLIVLLALKMQGWDKNGRDHRERNGEKRFRPLIVYLRCFINSEGSCKYVHSLFRGDLEKSFLVKDFSLSRETRETIVDHATKPVSYSSSLVAFPPSLSQPSVANDR